MVATGIDGARSEAQALAAARAHKAGLETWCGYAAWTAGSTSAELVAAAEIALAYARRLPSGTVIG